MRAYATRLITIVGVFILWQANKVGADPDELLNGFVQFGKEFLEKLLLQWRVPQLMNNGNGQLSFQVDSSNNLETPCPTCRLGTPREIIAGSWTIVMISRNLLTTRLAELDRVLARLERNQPVSQQKTFLEWISGAPDIRCARFSVLDSSDVSKYEIGYRLAINGRQRTVVGNWLRDETGTYIWELPAPISSIRLCVSFHGYLQNAVEFVNSPLEFPRQSADGHDFSQSNNNFNYNNNNNVQQLVTTTTTITTTLATTTRKEENDFELHNATVIQKQHEIGQLERQDPDSEKSRENKQQQNKQQIEKNEEAHYSNKTNGTVRNGENDSTNTEARSNSNLDIKSENIQKINNLANSGGIKNDNGNTQNISKLENVDNPLTDRDLSGSNEYQRINSEMTNKNEEKIEEIPPENVKQYEYKPKIFTSGRKDKSEKIYEKLAVSNATMTYSVEDDNFVQLSSVITKMRLSDRRKCTNRTKKLVHGRFARWASLPEHQPFASPLLPASRMQSQLSVDGLTLDASGVAAQPAVSRILPASAAGAIDVLARGELTQFLVLNQVDSSPMPCDNYIVLARFGSARVDSDQMLAKIAQIREFLERERVESVFNKLERIHCY